MRDIIVIVDGALVGGPLADAFSVDVLQGDGAVRVALATDTLVMMRNRRIQSANTGIPQRTGLLRITDNANALTGQPGSIAAGRFQANSMVYVPLGHRLFRAEQLFVRMVTLNQGGTATLWGRQATMRG